MAFDEIMIDQIKIDLALLHVARLAIEDFLAHRNSVLQLTQPITSIALSLIIILDLVSEDNDR